MVSRLSVTIRLTLLRVLAYVHPCTFFFNDTATTEIYTLSLHDALPISPRPPCRVSRRPPSRPRSRPRSRPPSPPGCRRRRSSSEPRSEEHTSELQSHVKLVCRLLLEKKKNTTTIMTD